MNERGVSSVVAVVLITLLSVVSAGAFLGFYLSNIKGDTSEETAFCFGIDLKMNECFIFDETVNPALVNAGITPLLPGTYALLMNVERFPGKGEINDLRFVVKDVAGNQYVHKPVNISSVALGFSANTDYSGLLEYASVDAVVRDLTEIPDMVSVSPVIGKSQTICQPIREPLKCVPFGA